MTNYKELKKLKNDCLEYAEKKFRGKIFTNLATGHKIEVSKKGLNEWFSKSKSLEQILSIMRLDDILINADYSHAAANTKNTELNAPSYEYYNYALEINSRTYLAIVTVRIVLNGKSNRRIYYHHYLDDLQIKKELPSSMPRNHPTEQ